MSERGSQEVRSERCDVRSGALAEMVKSKTGSLKELHAHGEVCP